jgi:hypothetical protein
MTPEVKRNPRSKAEGAAAKRIGVRPSEGLDRKVSIDIQFSPVSRPSEGLDRKVSIDIQFSPVSRPSEGLDLQFSPVFITPEAKRNPRSKAEGAEAKLRGARPSEEFDRKVSIGIQFSPVSRPSEGLDLQS